VKERDKKKRLAEVLSVLLAIFHILYSSRQGSPRWPRGDKKGGKKKGGRRGVCDTATPTGQSPDSLQSNSSFMSFPLTKGEKRKKKRGGEGGRQR